MKSNSWAGLTLPLVEVPRLPLPSKLDPSRLASTAEAAARALLRQGEAANTRLSYSSAMRYWCAWYAARYGQPLTLPVSASVVVQFIVDHAARRVDEVPVTGKERAASAGEKMSAIGQHGKVEGRDAPSRAGQAEPEMLKPSRSSSREERLVMELPPEVDAALVAGGYKAKLGPPALNTLVHRISVLSKAHQLSGADAGSSASVRQGARSTQAGAAGGGLNPCADPLVRELLSRTRRAYAQRGARPKRQRALTRDPLQALLATCDESLKGKRDRALLLFAWSTGGRRRSEVAGARLEDLQRVDGTSFVYTLGLSKTNQSGQLRPEDLKPLVGSAAQAMQAWLDELSRQGIGHGEIFRRIRRGDHIAEPLAPAAVRDIVRARAALAGVEGEYSAHSLRAGFVTEAGRRQLSLAETMAMTGHQSVASVVGYFRAESVLAGRSARLMDEP